MSLGYKVPYIAKGSMHGQEEIEAVTRILQSDQTMSCGPERAAFEAEFAAFTGARHALSLTNCTIALEFATYLLDLQPGDEVIVSPQTYQANAAPLLGLPISIKFCDIDANTLTASVESIEALVNDRTRAIYLVHHGGMPAEMESIIRVADRHGIRVVEDCAHALGSRYQGKPLGTFGTFGCWSFQSYKNISTLGEGGMLTLRDDRLAGIVERMRSIEPDADFVPREDAAFDDYSLPAQGVEYHAKNAYTEDCVALRYPGTNSTLCEPAAAVGRIQLRRLDALVNRRREVAAHLDAGLSEIDGVRIQTCPTGLESSHHLYTFFVEQSSGVDRDELVQLIDAAGVQVQLRYFPIHLLPEWRLYGHGTGECPIAERVWFKEQVNLPIYPQLEEWQINLMVDVVAESMNQARRR